MIAAVEIVTSHGCCFPDVEYVVMEGSRDSIDSRLMEIIENLREGESIVSVTTGEGAMSIWVDTRYFI